MIEYDEKLKSLLVSAIKKTKKELNEKYGEDKLFGYALCTDDAVTTIYHIACTNAWVKDRKSKFEEIGYISVEWEQSGDASHFDSVYDEILKNYERGGHEDDSFAKYRDQRFESFVQALKQCREENIFDSETHLSAGGTDPSAHLEFLEMRGIDRINKKYLADLLANGLCLEKYRYRY
jgi:hypothetical protein